MLRSNVTDFKKINNLSNQLILTTKIYFNSIFVKIFYCGFKLSVLINLPTNQNGDY